MVADYQAEKAGMYRFSRCQHDLAVLQPHQGVLVLPPPGRKVGRQAGQGGAIRMATPGQLQGIGGPSVGATETAEERPRRSGAWHVLPDSECGAVAGDRHRGEVEVLAHVVLIGARRAVPGQRHVLQVDQIEHGRPVAGVVHRHVPEPGGLDHTGPERHRALRSSYRVVTTGPSAVAATSPSAPWPISGTGTSSPRSRRRSTIAARPSSTSLAGYIRTLKPDTSSRRGRPDRVNSRADNTVGGHAEPPKVTFAQRDRSAGTLYPTTCGATGCAPAVTPIVSSDMSYLLEEGKQRALAEWTDLVLCVVHPRPVRGVDRPIRKGAVTS